MVSLSDPPGETLVDRSIAALRGLHDGLSVLVPGLSDAQLEGPSGAAEWTVAQVLSHLGSGAEIALAGLESSVAGRPAPDDDLNQRVWDRWNAMTPLEQSAGFIAADAALVAAFESLTTAQRETLSLKVGFLPFPLPVASITGMRLSETAQHSWDVRVAVDPEAGLTADAAAVLLEQFAGGLHFLLGFAGKAEELQRPAAISIEGSGFGLIVADDVSLSETMTEPTATFTGPLESFIRLIGGRLKPEHTPDSVKVDGNVTLDELRKVFPGF